MTQRCHDPKHASYPWYGERGIHVCERWRSLPNFIEDMGLRPAKGYTIDRLDNDKGYEPGNCRWATWTEQAETRRPSKSQLVYELDGERKTLSRWAREHGLKPRQLYERVERYGWDLEKALTTPIKSHPSQES